MTQHVAASVNYCKDIYTSALQAVHDPVVSHDHFADRFVSILRDNTAQPRMAPKWLSG
jgi:hypothetical protein